MDATKLHPIFQAACSSRPNGYNFGSPFGVAGKVYATDSRILVRCDGEAEAGVNVPPLSDLIKPDSEYGDPIPLPTTLLPMEKCEDCIGSGGSSRMCRDCDGCGKYECPNCHDGNIECKTCDGKGWLKTPGGKCKTCNRTGKVVSDRFAIDLGPLGINPRYIALLLAHGVTHIRPNLNAPDKSGMRFYGDGFDGVLIPMPRRPK